jgi:hypothetical protein
LQPRIDSLENRPKHSSLLLWQSRFPAQPANIAISLPRFQLPRINHINPLGPQKMLGKFVASGVIGCLR